MHAHAAHAPRPLHHVCKIGTEVEVHHLPCFS
jgi:hypothetical protein